MKCPKCDDNSVDMVNFDDQFYWHPSCDRYTLKKNDFYEESPINECLDLWKNTEDL